MIDATAVAGYGLDGAPQPEPVPLDGAAWQALLRQVTAHRLTGLLVAMAIDGALELSEEQEDDLVDAHRAALARDLLVERTVLWAVERLVEAGLEHRVLKGTAVAHLDYADPALRSFVDADILARPEQWDRAVAALGRAGARRDSREPRPGWDRRFAKCVTFHTPDGYEVDLHRTFVFGPLGFTVRLADLWAAPEPFSVGGVRLHALSREVRWLHACFTAGVADIPPRLGSLRDVLQMAADPRLDLTRVDALVRAWRAGGIVRRATDLATATLGAPLPTEVRAWVGSLVVARREEQLLHAYTDPGDRYVRLTLGAIRVVPGVRGKAAYAAGLLWPQADYVAYRYKGRLDRWQAVLSRARRAAAVGTGGQRRERVKGS